MVSEEYVQSLVLDVKALQLKDAWLTAVAMYRGNEAAKKILEDVLFDLHEHTEKDANDDEAWVLKSAVQATMRSLEHSYRGNYFRG